MTPVARLIESPKFASDDDFSFSFEANQAKAVRMLSTLPTGKIKVGTVELNYSTAHDQELVYVWLGQGDRLDYYAMVTTAEKLSGFNGSFASQLAIWRSAACPKGLPGEVFWDVVYQMHGQVLSDSSQTHSGRVFWRDRVSEALQRGTPAGVVDVKTGEVIRFTSMDHYAEVGPFVYGHEPIHADKRLVISPQLSTRS